MGKTDWVIVALKTTSLRVIPELISPLLGENTRVLTIMNGMYDDDLVDLMRKFSKSENELPCAAIYGGIAFICSSRINASMVHHSATDGLLLGGLAAMSVGGNKQEALSILEELWSPTKVPFQSEQSLALARWKKNCWNIPFSSVNVALQGQLTIEDIVKQPSLRALCDEIMDETIAIANADLIARGETETQLLGIKEVRFCFVKL